MPASQSHDSTSSSLTTNRPGDSTPAASAVGSSPTSSSSPTRYRRALRITRGGLRVVQFERADASIPASSPDPTSPDAHWTARALELAARDTSAQTPPQLPPNGSSSIVDEFHEHNLTPGRQVTSHVDLIQSSQVLPRRSREGSYEEALDRWENREVGQRAGFPASISRIRRAAALLSRNGTVTQPPPRSSLRDGAREQERIQERFRVAPYTPSWTRTSRSHENLGEASRRANRSRLEGLSALGLARQRAINMDAENNGRDPLASSHEYLGWAPGTDTSDHLPVSQPLRNSSSRHQSLQPVIGSSSMIRSSSGTTSLERRLMAERQRLHDRMAQEQESNTERQNEGRGQHVRDSAGSSSGGSSNAEARANGNSVHTSTSTEPSLPRYIAASNRQTYDYPHYSSRLQRNDNPGTGMNFQLRADQAPTSATYTQLLEQHERERLAHLARVQAGYQDGAQSLLVQQQAAMAGGHLTHMQRQEMALQRQESLRVDQQRQDRMARLDRPHRTSYRQERLRRDAITAENSRSNNDPAHVTPHVRPFDEVRRNIYDLRGDRHTNYGSNLFCSESSRKGVEKAIRYLNRIRKANDFDGRKDRLRAAEEEGFSGMASACGDSEDFMCDPRALDALLETSWLMPGTTFSGNQRAVMIKAVSTSLPQYTSASRERYNRLGASSDLLDLERPRALPSGNARLTGSMTPNPELTAAVPQRSNLIQSLQRDPHSSGNYTSQGLLENATRTSIERIRANRGVDSESLRYLDPLSESSRQTSGNTTESEDTWPVKVTITSVDYESMTLTGTMEAMNLPNKNGGVSSGSASDAAATTSRPQGNGPSDGGEKANSTITTFLEGEIIDLQHHSLETRDYKADSSIDSHYWRRLQPFKSLHDSEIVAKMLSTSWLQNAVGREYVLMRWKEKCFITPSDADMGLTICGFYYISLHRQTGRIEGLYYDPKSSPYQHLSLQPEPRMSFSSYTFR